MTSWKQQLGIETREHGWMFLEGYRVEVFDASRKGQGLRVRLEPPLDLGVRMKSMKADGAFDLRFWWEADDPERVRELLVEDLRAAMMTLSQHGPVGVEDLGVNVSFEGWLTDGWLAAAVPDAVVVAKLLDRQRNGGLALAAPVRAQAAGWETLAKESGLILRGSPLRLSGRICEQQVTAATQRTAKGEHGFTIEIDTEGLGLDLSIERAGALDRLTSRLRRGSSADRTVGDADFDRLFEVRSTRPDTLAYVVDAEVRRALSACEEACEEVRFRDGGASLAGRCDPADVRGVPHLVRLACGALEQMRENLRRGPRVDGGAYR